MEKRNMGRVSGAAYFYGVSVPSHPLVRPKASATPHRILLSVSQARRSALPGRLLVGDCDVLG